MATRLDIKENSWHGIGIYLDLSQGLNGILALEPVKELCSTPYIYIIIYILHVPFVFPKIIQGVRGIVDRAELIGRTWHYRET